MQTFFQKKTHLCIVLVYPFLICSLIEFTISKDEEMPVTFLGLIFYYLNIYLILKPC